MKGIDISMHNGTINFNSVKSDGIEVIIIKATEGVNYIDPNFEKNYSNSKNKGFNIGFYHFMSEKTSPTQQARDFYNAIKSKTFNVLPTLDVETNNYGRNKTEFTNRCVEFLNEFERLSNIRCMIYTGPYFANKNLDNRLVNYPCWIAHYGVSTPMRTNIWGNNYAGHQYTEDGRVNGISTRVDLNNFKAEIIINSIEKFEPLPLKMKEDAMSYAIEIGIFNLGNELTADAENEFAYTIELNGVRCFIEKANVKVTGISDERYRRTTLEVVDEPCRAWKKEIKPFRTGEYITAKDQISGYYLLDIDGASAYIRKNATEPR